RIMDQPGAAAMGGGGEQRHGLGVDQPGAIGVRLCLVDGGVSGGVDDDIRPVSGDEPRQLADLLEVGLGPATGDEFAGGREYGLERAADLPVLAQQQYFHAYCFSI